MYKIGIDDNYKNNIYSNDIVRNLHIYINGSEINGAYVRSIHKDHDILSGDTLSLGSATSQLITLQLDIDALNNIQTINEVYIEEKTTIGSKIYTIPLGYFYLSKDGIDTTNSAYVTLKLYDKMYFLSDLYSDCKSFINGNNKTRKQIVEDICNKNGLYLASTSFLGNDKVDNVYNEGLSYQTWLTYISERAGGFCRIGRTKNSSGKLPLYIIALNELDTYTIPSNMLGEVTAGDTYTITKLSSSVSSVGTDTGTTIYLSNDNILPITSTEVNNIYQKIKNISFQNLDVRTWGDSIVDAGDLITIGDYTTIAGVNMDYANGFYGNYKFEMKTASSTDEVVKTSSSNAKRYIQKELEEMEDGFELRIKNIEDDYVTGSTFTQKVGEITSQVTGIGTQVIELEENSVSYIEVLYGLGNDRITPPTEWSSESPEWTTGKYVWTKTITTYADGTEVESNATCIQGAKGEDGTNGTNGTNGTSYYTYVRYSANSNGANMVANPTSETKYIGVYSGTSASVPAYTQFTWSKYVGDSGTNGESVASITNKYLATNLSTGVTTSTSGWTNAIQTINKDKPYLWNYEIVIGSKGSTLSTTTPVIIGHFGADGTDGDDGDDGVSISSVRERYAVSNSNTTAPMVWYEEPQTMTPTNKYLWNYEEINYSDGNSEYTNKRVIGVYGDTGAKGETGATGKGITSTTIEYQASSSGTTTPTGSWSTTIPSVSTGQYLWTRTTLTFSDNSTKISYSVGYKGTDGTNGTNGTNGTSYYTYVRYSANSNGSGMVTSPTSTTKYIGIYTGTSSSAPAYQYFTWSKYVGENGTNGEDGDDGVGVSSITAEYYLSTSKTTQTGGSWSTSNPTWETGKYIWTRSHIIYTNNTESYTTPLCDSSWEAVNELTIGGTNLWAWSKAVVGYESSGSYTGGLPHCTMPEHIPVTPNEELYYQLWNPNLVNNTGNYTRVAWYDSNNNYIKSEELPRLAGDSYYSQKYTAPSNAHYVMLGTMIAPNETMQNTATKTKWERGNKPTDWTPAPEDLVTNVVYTSKMTQLDNEISAKLNANDVTRAYVIAKINNNGTSGIDLGADNITINSNNFKVDKTGNITATSGTIGGFTLGTETFTSQVKSDWSYAYTQSDVTLVQQKLANKQTFTESEIAIYDTNGDGIINALDLLIIHKRALANVTSTEAGSFTLNTKEPLETIIIKDKDGNIGVSMGTDGIDTKLLVADDIRVGQEWQDIPLASGISQGTIGGRPQYKKVGDHVFIRGGYKGTKGSGNLILGTLPVGYRPLTNVYDFNAIGGTRVARTYVNDSGNIVLEWVWTLQANPSAYTGAFDWIDVEMDFWVD